MKHLFHGRWRLGSESGDYLRFLDLYAVRTEWVVGEVGVVVGTKAHAPQSARMQ